MPSDQVFNETMSSMVLAFQVRNTEAMGGQLKVYRMALAGMTDEEFKDGAMDAMRSWRSHGSLPPISFFLAKKQLREDDDLRKAASAAYEAVLKVAVRLEAGGRGWRLDTISERLGEAARAAFDQSGGNDAWRAADDAGGLERSWLRKSFLKAYVAHVKARPPKALTPGKPTVLLAPVQESASVGDVVPKTHADAQLIATYRTAAPELAKAVLALTKERDELKALVVELENERRRARNGTGR